MFGFLRGNRVEVSSTGAVSTDEVMKSGVTGKADVNAIATRDDRSMSILVWNYHDVEGATPDSAIDLQVSGIPAEVKTVHVEHFRVDGEHSNSFTAWNAMGYPQSPDKLEYGKLEAAGQLQLLTSPYWLRVDQQKAQLNFDLPQEGLSLIRLSW
jgi:xylan 1,4-beta-xylosidase